MKFDATTACEELAHPQFLVEHHGAVCLGLIAAASDARVCRAMLETTSAHSLCRASAAVYAYGEWAPEGDPRFTDGVEYREKGTHTAFSNMCDRILAERLGKEVWTPSDLTIAVKDHDAERWSWVVERGVLMLNKVSKRGGIDSCPVCAAIEDEYRIANRAMRQATVKFSRIDAVAAEATKAVGPTLMADWIQLGNFMVSAWEAQRRQEQRAEDLEAIEQVREPKPVRLSKPPHSDGNSLVDWYRFTYDLGPFKIEQFLNLEAGPAIALSLTRDVTQEEAAEYLGAFERESTADGFTGFVFKETAEKFRIKPNLDRVGTG
jgi:hypothetical protein